MRDTLLAQPNVEEAAVDYDAGTAYVLPKEGFDVERAIAALGKDGKYKATVP